MPTSSAGTLYGASAYLIWGLSPLYWTLLATAGAVEILAQRVIWSLVALLAFLALRRHWSWVRQVLRNPRQLLLLGAAAAAISVNWGLFIHTVNAGDTLQAALGYFINPLVSVALGVLVFSERLRPAQWGAVALGVLAVAVLAFDYGAPPWAALGMAFAFATYGMVKKFVRLDGLESLSVETVLLFPAAFGYVLLLQASGAGTFGLTTSHTLLLVGSGLVTAFPLALFGAAAYRVPLSLLGLLQFIAPVIQFLIAWLVFAEELPPSRWIGFAIVWTALVVFVIDLVRNARRSAQRAGRPPANRLTTEPG